MLKADGKKRVNLYRRVGGINEIFKPILTSRVGDGLGLPEGESVGVEVIG